MVHSPELAAAETFLWLNARLIDRHRFAHLFKGGDVEPVVGALRAYQNSDGGFGHGLEPDGRGPDSQPAQVQTALQLLDEVGQCRGPMVTRALDYLASVTGADGGVPTVLPSVRRGPRAPWWDVEGESPPSSLLTTAAIVGSLLSSRVEHPWIHPAAAFCWQALETLEETHPYEIEFSIPFLDHAPDRDRAERAAERLGHLVRERRFVALDPDSIDGIYIPPGYGPGEVHSPLDYARGPTSLARRWFSGEEIERNLDALARGQQHDGGWTFNWRQWNAATTLDTRGAVTIRALTTLRAYGRLPH